MDFCGRLGGLAVSLEYVCQSGLTTLRSLPYFVVVLQPILQTGRTQFAELIKERLNLVRVSPEARKPLPVIDVHASQEVGNFDDFRSATARQHCGKAFRTLQIQRETPLYRRFRPIRRLGGILFFEEFHFAGF